jgi:hypothetical protein
MGRYGRNLGWSLLLLASFAKAAEKGKPKAAEKDKVTEIAWGDLRLLNLTTKLVPPELEKLIGQKVKIGGYAVPVETQAKTMEFLFVPDALACIQVPPPPPNLMIKALAEKELLMSELTSGPLWLEGELGPFNLKSQYGEPAITIFAAHISPYKK